jgi:hypothetical protein
MFCKGFVSEVTLSGKEHCRDRTYAGVNVGSYSIGIKEIQRIYVLRKALMKSIKTP